MSNKIYGKKYYSITIIIVILLILIVSMQNVPSIRQHVEKSMRTQITDNKLSDLQNLIKAHDIDNLQLFSKSTINKIDNGYILTGIGIQVSFTNTIIFNIENRNVVMSFKGANIVNPQYSKTLNVNISGREYIIYNNLYDGIDLVFSISNGILKSNYIIRSLDSLESLKVSYYENTVTPISIDNNILKVDNLWEEQGLILQTVMGDKIQSAVNFKLNKNNQYSFITEYDKTPFIIDPNYSFINFGKYIGGSNIDEGYAIALDSKNNIYITGYTSSMDLSASNNNSGVWDAFVASFKSNGKLRWSTYLGGSLMDEGNSIAIDSNDNVYITGWTVSADFPTKNAYDSTFKGNNYNGDAFITSFTSDGVMRWSTYFGGSTNDWSSDIAIDSNNNLYITGFTDSSDIPIKNAYDETFNGYIDAFMASFTSDGSLFMSTYFGGSSYDYGYSIAIGSDNSIFITGNTMSPDFPIKNAYNSTFDGYLNGDAFVISFSSDYLVRWSTFLGGSDMDQGNGIAVDTNNNVYIVGVTSSSNFPTKNAYNSTFGAYNPPDMFYFSPLNNKDVFVTSFTSDGTLRWSTFLGGSNSDEGYDITIDSNNNVFVTGRTASLNFPTKSAYNITKYRGYNAFVTSFTSDGNLRWSIYLGGSDSDSGNNIVADSKGNLFITGTTSSLDFPTNNKYNTNNGIDDAFLISISSPDRNNQYEKIIGIILIIILSGAIIYVIRKKRNMI